MYDEYDPDEACAGFMCSYYLLRVSGRLPMNVVTNINCLQVFCHIFTGPSLAADITKVFHKNNAKIHGMKKITPENIAYAAVQASQNFINYSVTD